MGSLFANLHRNYGVKQDEEFYLISQDFTNPTIILSDPNGSDNDLWGIYPA
jgi:hypothetical protein